MSKFKDSIVTEQGKALLFGTDKIIYTKAVLFSQDVSKLSVDDIRKLTSLDGDLLETPIGIHDRGDNTISIEASFSNHGLTQDIDFNSVGWFAKPDGGDEILVTVSPTDGIQSLGAQAPGQASDDAINLVMSTTVADSGNVTVTVDPAGQVTPAKLDSVINNFKTDITQVINDSTKVQDFPYRTVADLNDLPDGSYRFSNMGANIVKLTQNLPEQVPAVLIHHYGYIQSITINDHSTFQILRGINGRIYYRVKNGINYWLPWNSIDAQDIPELKNTAKQLKENLDTKADKSDTYTKAEIDDKISKTNTDTASSITNLNQKLDQSNKNITTAQSTANTANSTANSAKALADSANTTATNALPKSGGTMGTTAQIKFADSGTWNTNKTPAGKRGGIRWEGQSDFAEIYADENGKDNLDLAINLGDDGSNHVSFRKNGTETSAITSDGHFTGTVDWNKVNGRPANFDTYQLKERRSLGANDDANNIIETGIYRISGSPIKNGNNLTWCFLIVLQWDLNSVQQYLVSTDRTFARKISKSHQTYPNWHYIAQQTDIDNLQNQINQVKSTMPQVQQFSDENQAKSWSNSGGNQLRIAIIK